MVSKPGVSGAAPPKRFWTLLRKYLALNDSFEKKMEKIRQDRETKIEKYREERGSAEEIKLIEATDMLRYIDEFVENLISYYAYYRNIRRSLATLFASVGITDSQMFTEMVRVSSDPHVVVRAEELDVPGVGWFLNQFMSDYEDVEIHKDRLIAYLPRLKEAATATLSGAMQRFSKVLAYISSDDAEQLIMTGLDAVKKAVDEEDLGKKLNLVVESIISLVKYVHNHPAFILTESLGYFGPTELEEFDQKIQSFEQLRGKFKDHVSLCDRTQWVFRRHHVTVLSSIFVVTHLQLVDIMHRIRRGGDIMEFVSQHRDCQEMLLGISQANTLYLEYSAYQEQMLGLVESYRLLADFLQCPLLEIFHDMEVHRNNLYIDMRDKYKEFLEGFQQTLLEVCSLETNSTSEPS